jgi:hypothetical protein
MDIAPRYSTNGRYSGMLHYLQCLFVHSLNMLIMTSLHMSFTCRKTEGETCVDDVKGREREW